MTDRVLIGVFSGRPAKYSMTFEVREGQGVLFANEHNEGRQPDYRGNARVGGVLYRLAGWRRESNGGKRWLSLSTHPDQRAQKPQETRPTPQPTQPEPRELGDDTPFRAVTRT